MNDMSKYWKFSIIVLVLGAFLFQHYVSVSFVSTKPTQDECVREYMTEHRGEKSDAELITDGIHSDECTFNNGLYLSIPKFELK